MLAGLEQAGYRMTRPEGTFYLWGVAPGGDADAFSRRLLERGVHVLPGTFFDRPGHFRISLTATMATIERALPVFAHVIHAVEG
jgi:aspartate aminotransferase